MSLDLLQVFDFVFNLLVVCLNMLNSDRPRFRHCPACHAHAMALAIGIAIGIEPLSLLLCLHLILDKAKRFCVTVLDFMAMVYEPEQRLTAVEIIKKF